MGHVPKLVANGYTCCGFDDDTIKWYKNEEHGYTIAARSAEEAESIALKGIARDFGRCRLFWYSLNIPTKARLAKTMRSQRIEMIECCLEDIRVLDKIGKSSNLL